jgi:hypothetical protein
MQRTPRPAQVYLTFDSEKDKRLHFQRLSQLDIISNAVGLVLIVIVLLCLSRFSGVLNAPVH